MTRIVDLYFRFLKFTVAACLTTMVVLVFGNVVLRYCFNSGITVSEELSRWVFIWLTFIGAITAWRENAHIGMNTVVSRLPVWGKKLCYGLSHLIMLVCIVTFLMGSWKQTMLNLKVSAPATKLSTAWFYGSGLFFSIMVFLLLAYNLYALLSGRLKDRELVHIRESEEELDERSIEEIRQKMEHAPADEKGETS